MEGILLNLKQMRILKYALRVAEEQIISAPSVIQCLSIQASNMPSQHKQALAWCMVDENSPLKAHKIICCGTGEEIPNVENLLYLGTVETDGFCIWHYFLDTTY